MGTGLEPLLRGMQGQCQAPGRRRRARANCRTSRGHSAPPRALQAQGAIYEVEIESYKDSGGHVEYLCHVTHKSGLHWRVWRRYGDLGKLHDSLATILGETDSAMLPPFEEHLCWVPSFAQSLSSEVCDHRMRLMQTFLDAVLQEPQLVQLEPVQHMLGVQAPEAPAGLRVVHRPGGHELEVRPACVEAACGPEMIPGPVDGYKIEIKNVETGSCHSIVREVGLSGLQVQRAQVGDLAGARHEFTASAFNLAGVSVSVSILVKISMQAANPPNPPAGVAAGEVSSSTSHGSVRAQSPNVESSTSLLEAATQTPAAPGASTAVPPPVGINTGSPSVYRAAFSPLSRRSIAHASPVAVHPSNDVSARLLPHGRMDLASGLTSHADGLGNRNPHSEGSHLAHASAHRMQRNPQPLDVSQSRTQTQRPRAQNQLQGNRVLEMRAQPTHLGPSNVQTSLPFQGDSRTRRQQQPQPQRLQPQPRAQIQDASSPQVVLGENPLFSPQAGLSGMVAPVMQQSARLQSHEWVQPSQLRIASSANPASASGARLCEDGEDQQCVVCLTAEKTHAFVPCGHRCVCRSCGSELLKGARPCPICRARAQSILQIFV